MPNSNFQPKQACLVHTCFWSDTYTHIATIAVFLLAQAVYDVDIVLVSSYRRREIGLYIYYK